MLNFFESLVNDYSNCQILSSQIKIHTLHKQIMDCKIQIIESEALLNRYEERLMNEYDTLEKLMIDVETSTIIRKQLA